MRDENSLIKIKKAANTVTVVVSVKDLRGQQPNTLRDSFKFKVVGEPTISEKPSASSMGINPGNPDYAMLLL